MRRDDAPGKFLADMDRVVPWHDLVAVVEPHYARASPDGGGPPVPLQRMLRIYFLQLWFNLSDPAVKEALHDSVAMREFVGIDLGLEAAPDDTTVCRCRHLLGRAGAWGTLRERVEVPERFTIGTHPISADGWHAWVPDAEPGAPARIYGLEASADAAKPIRGLVRDTPIERLGDGRIAVPAGEFDTVRYRILGSTDIWIHGEDRLMVRMRNERADRDYVLTRLTTGR